MRLPSRQRRPPGIVPGTRTSNDYPARLRWSLALIRLAGRIVPRRRRSEWQEQWHAELIHRWQRREEISRSHAQPTRGLVLWSLGAFSHAWYLFRTEYTMDLIWQDVKFGIRALKRGKGLIAVAVLSLAIGIGANTSIFSAVDVFMLRPLPYPDSDELHVPWITNQERGWTQVSYSMPDFVDLREQSTTMLVAATTGTSFNLSGGDRPERLTGRSVSANFFQVLGVQPSLGRGFTPDEEREGQGHVAVISDGLWKRRFGADPSAVGSTLLLDGETYTIVGVMQPRFWYLYPGNEIYTPLTVTGEEPRDGHYLHLLGRLRDGVDARQAQQETHHIQQQLALEYPETSAGHGATMWSLHEDIFDEGFKAGTLIATVAVAFVLLIACANVANLLLTHASGRDREVALRGALGANRSRIVRQFLTEAIMVSVMGGVLGLALSIVGIRSLVSLMPASFPRVQEIGLSPRVLLYTAAVTMLTGIIFGLAPALQSSRHNVVDALKEGGRVGAKSAGVGLRKALVVGEVSLALVLLVSSALLVQGFARIRLADLGFDRSDVLTMEVVLPPHDYPDTASVAAFYTEAAARLAAVPGVETVGATSILPLQGGSGTYYTVPGEDAEDDSQRKVTGYRYILPGYFDAMDIPLLRGRGITESDRAGLPRVLVINETMAQRHWPGEDPVGLQISFYSGPREIVGIVADTKDGGADDTVGPMVYFSAYQGLPRFIDWAIETSGPPEALAEAARAEIHSIDSNLPVYDVMSLDAVIEESLGGDTIMAKIMAALAVIALVLALGGVYGVMAYTVSQRTQELGIRRALGAQNRDVLSLVVRQGTALALFGVGVGTVVALGVARGLSRFLFGVSPFDPVTYASVAIALLTAGLAASYFPARRATKVDPIVALRVE
jgi:putative ABC transport system permease protein